MNSFSVFLLPVFFLKALYTIGNCQRPVFSLGVFHHKHNKNKPVNIWAQLVNKDARKWWKKKTWLDEFVSFQIGIKDF